MNGKISLDGITSLICRISHVNGSCISFLPSYVSKISDFICCCCLTWVGIIDFPWENLSLPPNLDLDTNWFCLPSQTLMYQLYQKWQFNSINFKHLSWILGRSLFLHALVWKFWTWGKRMPRISVKLPITNNPKGYPIRLKNINLI